MSESQEKAAMLLTALNLSTKDGYGEELVIRVCDSIHANPAETVREVLLIGGATQVQLPAGGFVLIVTAEADPFAGGYEPPPPLAPDLGAALFDDLKAELERRGAIVTMKDGAPAVGSVDKPEDISGAPAGDGGGKPEGDPAPLPPANPG